jgi:ABC-type multidrug transport system permease subunit
MVIAGIELAETGGNLANLIFSLCLIFCGVLASPDQMPRFWIFMYRVSPFTYLVSAMLSTGVSGADATCSAVEYLSFKAPANETCKQYMAPWIASYGGSLMDENAVSDCQFCSLSTTDAYLDQIGAHFSEAWRNFGIMWAFIIFNIFGAVFIYWLARVPKGSRSKN